MEEGVGDNLADFDSPLGKVIDLVIARLQLLGVGVHSQGRIARMRNAFASAGSATGVLDKDDPTFELALEAIREFSLFSRVLAVIRDDEDLPGMLRLLKEAGKDPVLPQQVVKTARGRNALAELYAASIFKSACSSQVQLGEPDVIVQGDSRAFGVAVKRAKSQDGLENRIREGASQVSACGMPGVLFIDVSQAFNLPNERITRSIPRSMFEEAHGRALSLGIELCCPELSEWVRKKRVRGVFFFDHQVRYLGHGRWEFVPLIMAVDTSRNNDRRHREFKAIEMLVRAGTRPPKSLGYLEPSAR